MKIWPFLIGIIVILAIFCSTGLAISKSELISQYQAGRFSGPTTPTPTPTPQIPSWFVPSPSILPWKNDVFNQLLERWKAVQRQEIKFLDTTTISKKPNIYLYSDRDLTARVRLAPEQAIIVSEPAYRHGVGWRVEIRNGSLNGAGDFLFYEALVPDSGWQKTEGYVIRAANREQDMAFMLGQYEFNEEETVEFIDYWARYLTGDVDYVFYPQETGAVDRVMPVYISPEPDEVSRIWFYAEPLVSAPEPVTCPEKIVRDGFHVVEWGVMVRDE